MNLNKLVCVCVFRLFVKLLAVGELTFFETKEHEMNKLSHPHKLTRGSVSQRILLASRVSFTVEGLVCQMVFIRRG